MREYARARIILRAGRGAVRTGTTMRVRSGLLVGGSLLITVFSLGARAADPDPEGPLHLEVFQEARPLTAPDDSVYPESEKREGKAGWVLVNMMIDPKGKPYEVNLLDSSGDPVLDAAASKAVERMKFEPAREAGKPIDSSLTFKLQFYPDWPGEISNKFTHTYERLTKAIDVGNKDQADTQLSDLRAQSSYEGSFRDYAQYLYDSKWGTLEHQVTDLRRAFGGDSLIFGFVPRIVGVRALTTLFSLEVSSRDYGAALQTWKKLKRFALKADRAELQKTVDQLMALRSDDRPLVTAGSIGQDGWNGWLFKNHFFIAVKQGAISAIKLRCQKKYVSIEYDPDTQYTVSPSAGDCGINVIGDPGTKFDLVQ
jgi:TonB family protein